MNFQKITTLDIESTPEKVVEKKPTEEKPPVDDNHKTDSEKMCSHEKEIYSIMNQLRRRIDDLEKDNDVHRERIDYLIGLIKEAGAWK